MDVKKARGLIGLAGSIFGAVNAFSSLRAARGDKDKLALANAVAGIVVAITGAALAVRGLRKGGKA
ncbi:hypothetical protein GCM10022243_49480 [Saccharothrix violaceirubra]|uniref:Uncharacterized protein n=1 Tax=Saccharothrix violaceirubra TaxID=413306 RepID=A0A7W7WUS2_9PSEU|nr:hypothetical protein [Saccharothrix violaceirubra]MBB4963708.1 hypothetical protein [Saccharothrix violaceirubra]